MACSKDILEMKFNWCSGEASVAAAYRKTLKSIETHPKVKVGLKYCHWLRDTAEETTT